MKKKYLILDEAGVNYFNIIVEETDKGVKTSIFASESGEWALHYKGELLASMIDDGNGVKFGKKIKRVGYDEMEHIRLLINFDYRMSSQINQETHRFVEEDKLKLI